MSTDLTLLKTGAFWESHREALEALLRKGIPLGVIAERFGTTRLGVQVGIELLKLKHSSTSGE